MPVIHVGGTNGKGSVVHLVYAALRAAGFRVARYTSPHLVDVRERMVVDDRPISRAAFAMWTNTLRHAIDETGASFFEATTAIAFADFAARHADIAVVEVGLGGRLDSTNVVVPLVSAVTHVALEHADYLGNDLLGIAREKAGIAKPGTPFVIGEPDSALAAELETAALAVGATPVRVPRDALYDGALGPAGPFQRRNAAIARAVLCALPPAHRPDDDAMRRGFCAARVPGRYDRRGRWLFDVAHNPDGMRVLAGALAADPPPRPLHVLVGVLGDKAWREMLDLLLGVADDIWATMPVSAPADRRWDLAAVAHAYGDRLHYQPDFDSALTEVHDGAGTVLVCGSFHTVGDAMARLPAFAPRG